MYSLLVNISITSPLSLSTHLPTIGLPILIPITPLSNPLPSPLHLTSLLSDCFLSRLENTAVAWPPAPVVYYIGVKDTWETWRGERERRYRKSDKEGRGGGANLKSSAEFFQLVQVADFGGMGGGDLTMCFGDDNRTMLPSL